MTNKPINLGEVLVEHIEIAACASRSDKKLAFPGFITHYCLANGLKQEDNDVLIPLLENLSDKRVTNMSYTRENEELVILLGYLENRSMLVMYLVLLLFLLGLFIRRMRLKSHER